MGNSKDFSGTWSLTSRYLAALLATAVMALVEQLSWHVLPYNPISPFVLAVSFCPDFAGLGSGLLPAAISFLQCDAFFMEPYFFFWLPKQVGLVPIQLVAIIGSSLGLMSELWSRIGAKLPGAMVNPLSGGLELCKI